MPKQNMQKKKHIRTFDNFHNLQLIFILDCLTRNVSRSASNIRSELLQKEPKGASSSLCKCFYSQIVPSLSQLAIKYTRCSQTYYVLQPKQFTYDHLKIVDVQKMCYIEGEAKHNNLK